MTPPVNQKSFIYGISGQKVIFFIVIIFSIVNILPFIILRDEKRSSPATNNSNNIYYDGTLSHLELQGALIGSIGAAIPVLLDLGLDLFYSIPKNSFSNFVPRLELLTLFFLPNIVLLAVLIPYADIRLVGCLMNSRDSIVLYVLLNYLYKLVPTVFSGIGMVSIGLPLLITNIFDSFAIVSDRVNSSKAIVEAHYSFIGFAILIVIILYVRWGRFLLFSSDHNMHSKEIYICNLYAIFTAVYIFVNFMLSSYIHSYEHNPLWSTTGLHYITTYTCILSVGCVGITVLTSRLSRFEQAAIQQSLETRKAFMRYISHEIRTPLNIIVAGLKVLEEDIGRGESAEDIVETILDIRSCCGIAIDTLSEVLTYDKVETRKMTLELSRFSLEDFLVETLRPFHLQASANGITFDVKLDPQFETQDYFIVADQHKLSQVMRNVVSNAIKFTPKPGHVTVTVTLSDPTMASAPATTPGDWPDKTRPKPQMRPSWLQNTTIRGQAVKIDVIDTGAGISKDNQAKLFRDVVQFNPGKLQAGGGTGLGLYISKGIVDLHNGELTVFSPGEGKGSTFSVILPLLQSESSIHRGRSTRLKTINLAEGGHFNFNHLNVHKLYMNTQETVTTVPLEEGLMRAFDHAPRRASMKGRPSVSLSPHGVGGGDYPRLLSIPRIHSPTRSSTVIPLDCPDSNDDNRLFPSTSSPPFTDIRKRTCSREEKADEVVEMMKTLEMVTHEVTPVDRVINILVVDDSEANRKMMKRLMRGRCECCDLAEDGLVAVERVRQSLQGGTEMAQYTVLLMDFNMPNMNGPEAAQAIRALGYRGLIIGLTGEESEVETERFLRSGADHILTKPLNIDKYDALLEALPWNAQYFSM